jgi:hypothetical protein
MHVLLTPALVGDEWSASRPYRSTPRGKSPRYRSYRTLGEPQRRSGRFGEVKILLPFCDSGSDPQVVLLNI